MNKPEPTKLPHDSLMSINECPNCQGRHNNLHVREFAKPYGIYTHYFLCPTTNDPGMLCIKTYDGKIHDLTPEMTDKIIEAQAAGEYMVAVWHRLPNGETHMYHMTEKFPKASFKAAQDLLQRRLDDLAGNAPEQRPMAQASPGRNPLASIFGSGEQGRQQQEQMLRAVEAARAAATAQPAAQPSHVVADAMNRQPQGDAQLPQHTQQHAENERGENAKGNASYDEPKVVWQQENPEHPTGNMP